MSDEKDGGPVMTDPGHVSSAAYELAVKGRREFRTAFRQMRLAAVTALRHMDHATPKQRNGPVYQVANVLRAVMNLPPMEPGGKPSDDISSNVLDWPTK